jgi:hypothetical protein
MDCRHPHILLGLKHCVLLIVSFEPPVTDSAISIELGHLDKDGAPVPWEVQRKERGMACSWFRWHDEFEQLPNGQLII